MANALLKNDKGLIRAWTFYDWANSVFPLVITSAIFPNYYEYITSHVGKVSVGNDLPCFGGVFKNYSIYAYIYAFSLFLVALTAPVLSGIADYLGNRKRFLQFFCYLGAISCGCLYFFDRNHPEISFIPFVSATIGFWGSLVFYNSYLPEIASREEQDRVSARGFAMGYLGSSILLIVCLILIVVLGVSAKYSFILVGFWWIGFAQITFKRLPNSSSTKVRDASSGHILTKGFREIKNVMKEVMCHTNLKRFLTSYFFYNMGVQTVMVMAVLFAREEIVWVDEKTKTNSLIVSILLIQFLGIAGSFLFSWVSRKIGNLNTLAICIIIWIGICVFTFSVAHFPIHFYILAAAVGLVMGGIQSLSRSTYSKYLPETEDHASFFSLYDVLEKLGMILGTLSFGLISEATGGMRNAVLSLIAYFIIGLILLFFIPRIDSQSREVKS